MTTKRPIFMDSPYFVMEEDNWHLKDGAPEEIVKEFNEFMKETDLTSEIKQKQNENVKKSFSETMKDLLKDFSKS